MFAGLSIPPLASVSCKVSQLAPKHELPWRASYRVCAHAPEPRRLRNEITDRAVTFAHTAITSCWEKRRNRGCCRVLGRSRPHAFAFCSPTELHRLRMQCNVEKDRQIISEQVAEKTMTLHVHVRCLRFLVISVWGTIPYPQVDSFELIHCSVCRWHSAARARLSLSLSVSSPLYLSQVFPNPQSDPLGLKKGRRTKNYRAVDVRRSAWVVLLKPEASTRGIR